MFPTTNSNLKSFHGRSACVNFVLRFGGFVLFFHFSFLGLITDILPWCFYSFPDNVSSPLPTWFYPCDGSTWSTAGIGGGGVGVGAAHFSKMQAFQIPYLLLPTVSTSRWKGGETEWEAEKERGRWWEDKKETATAGSLHYGNLREKWVVGFSLLFLFL